MASDCPVCGSARATPILSGLPDLNYPDRPPRHRILRCACGMAWTDPPPDPDYQVPPLPYHVPSPPRARASLFARAREKFKLWGKRCYEEPFRRRGAVLDVGCRDGLRFPSWLRQQHSVTGIELDPAAAERGRGRGFDIRCCALEDAGFPDGSFDVVTLSHVLEHVSDPRRLLLEARRVLKDDGELLVWVPNRGSLFRRWFRTAWYPYGVPGHAWHFDPASLAGLLRACGWRPVELAFDPSEQAFRRSARLYRGLFGSILRRRSVRMLCMVAAWLLRRTDAVRIRAVKESGAPRSSTARP